MEKKRDTFFLSKKKMQNGEHKEHKQEYTKKRQEKFDENRDIENSENTSKKPFDKKAYRLKKYSKKYKLEQWEEQRKKKLLRDYYKEVQSDPAAGLYKPKNFDEDTTDSSHVGRFVRHPDLIEKEDSENKKSNRKDPFQKAKEQYNKIKQDKLLKKEQIEKAKEEKQKKMLEYKKSKQERFKKLSKKNKKGQPVMTGRLELLLEKIQKNSN